tara:strand:+ start:567 stop:1457 length:891 start_codon:yes stop_codon:yes gene_type:complete
MNTETLVRHPTAKDDLAKFIRVDDIADWFVMMLDKRVKSFYNIFTEKDMMERDMKNDWLNTVRLLIEPSAKDMDSLRRFWNKADETKYCDLYGRPYNQLLASERRAKIFKFMDKRSRMDNNTEDKKWEKEENKNFMELIYAGNAPWFVKIGHQYGTGARYFDRIGVIMRNIINIVMAIYGFDGEKCYYSFGFGLTCSNEERTKLIIQKSEGLKLLKCDMKNGHWGGHKIGRMRNGFGWKNKLRYMITVENLLFKFKEQRDAASIIEDYVLTACYNPNTKLGRAWAVKLYDDNFSGE